MRTCHYCDEEVNPGDGTLLEYETVIHLACVKTFVRALRKQRDEAEGRADIFRLELKERFGVIR